MKKAIIALLSLILLVTLASCATYGTVDDIHSEKLVVEAPGNSAEDLYVKAASWMVDSFNSSDSVIEYEDKEAGIIKGKFRIVDSRYDFEMSVTVETRPERARLSIIPTGIYGNYNEYLVQSSIDEYNAECLLLLESFKAAIQAPYEEW